MGAFSGCAAVAACAAGVAVYRMLLGGEGGGGVLLVWAAWRGCGGGGVGVAVCCMLRGVAAWVHLRGGAAVAACTAATAAQCCVMRGVAVGGTTSSGSSINTKLVMRLKQG